ncbi:hypothetical protein NBRC116583_17950 [Arenicella sp. 4NH20-0111]|uniref:hypothetical protein n=1 Tax=Arenicella sp. 4NH20-0111 TaxID=3127648 RepID=UPI003103A4BC
MFFNTHRKNFLKKIRIVLPFFAFFLTLASYAQTQITRDGVIKSEDVEPFSGYGIYYNPNTLKGTSDQLGPLSAQLNYRVFFSVGNYAKRLLKPIVIVDGFDPGDKRRIQRRDYLSGEYVDGKTITIEDMMDYESEYGPRNLIEELTKRGFDVVIVNHPTHQPRPGVVLDGGADYIERNALAHVVLIQRLNEELLQNGSSEELVIVGPSMGGQITRYALAYMEKNGLDHRTRLWVSIDSPHNGANISIGLQTMVFSIWDKTKGDSPDPQIPDFYFNQIQSIAAQQQLIELHNPDLTKGDHFIYLKNGSPVRQRYMGNLTNNGLPGSNGYPIYPRKVAISNGSLVGTKVGVEAEEDFRAHGFVRVEGPFGITLPGQYQALEMVTRRMPEFNKTADIASLWIEGKGRKTGRVTNYNSNGSMDVVPGGYFNAVDQLYDAVTGSDPDPLGHTLFENSIEFLAGLNIDIEGRVNKVIHSFIPTYSSLGIIDTTGDWSRSLNRNLICTGETPFDSYYAPRENQQHTSFNGESVEWMFGELDKSPQSPSVYPSIIEGSNVELCAGGLRTFSFSQCDVPEPPVWTVDPGLSVVSSTPYSVTVRGAGYFNSYSNIKANFPNISLSKRLYIGRPQTPSSINGPSSVSSGGIARYSGGTAVGARSYAWHVPHPYQTVQAFSYTGLNWEMQATSGRSVSAYTGTQGRSGYVQIMGVNQCGTGGAKMMEVTHASSGGGGSGDGSGDGNGNCRNCGIRPGGTPIP